MGYNIQMIAPTSFFSDTGCHVRILEEIWSLQAAGHKVTVCTYHMGDGVPDVAVRRSLDVPWRKGVQVGSSRHKLYFDAMLALKAAQVALTVKPDIIHAHLHEGALVGFPLKWLLRRGRVPLIFDFQGSLTNEMVDHHFLKEKGLFYKPTLRLERLINRMPDKIITSSHNAARVLQDEFNVSTRRVVTISDRVNYERFRPAQTEEEHYQTTRLRQRLGIPFDRKVVVYLGLLAQYQGTDLLLEAARLLRDEMPSAYFVIMGYPGVESYSQKAKEMGLDNVIFPGRIPYQQAPAYLRLGDVAVAPKMSATEGAGKITNYMAMGLPVVTFESPVSREILGDLGVYATYGSSVSLAGQLKSLLADDQRCLELGQALRDKVMEGQGWTDAARELEAVYRETLSALKPRRLPHQLGSAADSGHDQNEVFTTASSRLWAVTRELVSRPFSRSKRWLDET